MSSRATERLRLMQMYESGQLSRKEVAQALGKSERQVSRIAQSFSKNSIEGLNHGNFGKRSPKLTPPEITSRILELAQTKYGILNATHLHEKLIEKEKIEIGASTLRRLVHKLPSRKRSRRSRKIRKLRNRYPSLGIMLQMDGSEHAWVHGKSWCLISGIDDATSTVPYGVFTETEGLEGYLTVIRWIVENWGIPRIIYVDHAAWLSGTARDDQAGQFKRICDDLGISIIYANSPQAKGRIERLWGTFQDRLVSELFIEQITDIEAATQYLNDVFLPKQWNAKFTVEPKNQDSLLRPVIDSNSCDEIFCYRYERVIRNDETILWGNRQYQIENRLGFALAKRKAEIRLYPDGRLSAYVLGKKLELTKIRRTEDKAERPSPQQVAQGLKTMIQPLDSGQKPACSRG